MSQVKFTSHAAAVKKKLRAARDTGLELAAEHLLATAIPLTPKDDGPLRASGTVSVDKSKGQSAVSYDTPYAARQHEELTWHHTEGQAKYLETPFHSEADVMKAIIATQYRRATRS